MDKNLSDVIEKRIGRTVEALTRNRMAACVVKTRAQALEKALALLPKGGVVTHGGSMTLAECGIPDALRQRGADYTYLDRSEPGLTREQVWDLYRRSFFADCYLGSANAVTETGEIFNVDGNANRVAAYLFGPKRVIMVAGYNKIVPDLDAALSRLRRTAGPAVAIRVGSETPCAKTGICADCRTPARVCCNYVVQGYQREEGRIQVILVEEELGY